MKKENAKKQAINSVVNHMAHPSKAISKPLNPPLLNEILKILR